jgi:uncharacterized protein
MAARDLRPAAVSHLMRISLLATLVCLALAPGTLPQGIRVVDSVDVSSPRDEAAHAFAGEQTQVGESAGLKWRSATGWFSYSLKIYDDSPLTILFVIAAGPGDRETFDVLVDGTRIATVDREAGQHKPEEAKFEVPFPLTKGRLSVTVKLQAHDGSRTARVLEIRTVQEHLE